MTDSRKQSLPIPVTLADGTECASLTVAARALGCDRSRVRRAIKAGRPLTPQVNVAALAVAAGLTPECVRSRVRRGMSLERALKCPRTKRAEVCAEARRAMTERRCARILDAWHARWAA